MLNNDQKREAKRAYKFAQLTPPPGEIRRVPTLRDLYKEWIFDKLLPKKLSDLIMPPRTK